MNFELKMIFWQKTQFQFFYSIFGWKKAILHHAMFCHRLVYQVMSNPVMLHSKKEKEIKCKETEGNVRCQDLKTSNSNKTMLISD